MELAKTKLLIMCVAYLSYQSSAAPADATLSLVVSSTEAPKTEDAGKEGEAPAVQATVPKISQMHIRSNISNRYAYTTITSKVKNVADKAQEATFSVVLPETAFISGFIMEVDSKNYTAYVKEKEEAKKDYDQAVASGVGAAHVAVSARDSNRFTVSVNIEPEKKAAFYLSYEQLLKREDGRYEQVININPGQPVKDLSVEVAISESRKITDLKAPPLRSGNEIGNENVELDPRADIQILNETAAIVKFSPNLERQKQLAKLLKTEENDGFSGQFVVQYDVERDPTGGEVLVQDGYFVHFFAPTELEPLPKHVVFVLDTSGSMYDEKIRQLKEAMTNILEQLHPKDLFNLVEFNSNIRVWDLQDTNKSVWYPVPNQEYHWGRNSDEEISFDNYTFPDAYLANPDNIKQAKDTVAKFEADGGTDIFTSLKVGLHLVDLAQEKNVDDVKRQPIIVFLTDGEPTIRETSLDQITKKMSELNSGSRKSPIFSLSFGAGADKKFLQKLSIRNYGFSKHIYEAADASLQLQDFYRQISSPLLADVKFKYEPTVTSLTKTEFPIHFRGSEIVIAGWCGTDFINPPEVDGIGSTGRVALVPKVEQAISSTERLWAYMTIQQLLEKKESSDKDQEELKKKALDLALKYSFVTSLSSLVVVKPNDTSAVDTEEASKSQFLDRFVHTKRKHTVRVGAKPLAIPYNGGSYNKVSGYGGAALSFAAYPAAPIAPAIAYEESLPVNDLFSLSTPLILSTRVPLSTTITSTASSALTLITEAPPSEKISTLEDLLAKLPWLKDILDENNFVKLSTGNYKLGLNETLVDNESSCVGDAVQCTLLKDCSQSFSKLTTFDLYVQHSCILKNEFAGVCCPVS